jgi:hypothetical protein
VAVVGVYDGLGGVGCGGKRPTITLGIEIKKGERMTGMIVQLDVTTPEVIRLHETIKAQIEATEKQTKTMFWLSVAMFLLTIVQVAFGAYEILK